MHLGGKFFSLLDFLVTDLGGTLQLVMSFSGAVGNQYVIIKNDGTDAIVREETTRHCSRVFDGLARHNGVAVRRAQDPERGTGTVRGLRAIHDVRLRTWGVGDMPAWRIEVAEAHEMPRLVCCDAS